MKRIAFLLSLTILVFGCDPKKAEPEAPKETSKEAPKEEKEKTKLTFAFQPQENPEGLMPNAEKLKTFVEKETGYEVEIFVPTTYASVVEAMRSNNADVAYFSAWPYLKAHMMANAELLLVEERNGQPFYYSHWYVAKDSKIKELKDLKGKKIAFTSPTSTSGYLFPMAELVKAKIVDPNTEGKLDMNAQFAGGYESALKTLANGKVDAAAASDYALARYLSEEEQKKIRVLHKQGPVPTHLIAVNGDLDKEIKDTLKKALLKLNEAENTDLLKSVYGAEKLIERSHFEHTQDLEKAQQLIGHDYQLPAKKKAAPKEGAASTPTKKTPDKAPTKKAEPKKTATSGSK